MHSTKDNLRIALLVVRAKKRDADAARELVGLFESPLLYYVRRIVDSEADAWDVLQETWLRVFRSLGKLREPRTFVAYVYATARRRAITHLRSRAARQALLANAATMLPTDEHVDEINFTHDDAAAIHRGLDRLSLPHREVLTLFFLEELSIAEIASVIGVPAGTVKSRLHHARLALRAILNTEGVSDDR